MSARRHHGPEALDAAGGATPSAAELAALARAVAATDDVVWLRTQRGRKVSAGHTTLDHLDRIAAGAEPELLHTRMYAVRVAGDVIAIDVDDPGDAAAARAWAETCAGHGVPCVIVESGRAGHLHLWARPSDDALHEFLDAQARAAGLEVRTGNYMRPPGSPNGYGPVTIEGGATAALEALAPTERSRRVARSGTKAIAERVAPQRSGSSRTAARHQMPLLSRNTVAVLRGGDGNADRSRTFQRVVVGMVNAGWDLDGAWEVLSSGRFVGAAKFNEKLDRYGDDTAYSYLAHCWDSAVSFVEANPPAGVTDEVRERLEDLQLAADRHPWRGEAGGVTWMVLHRLIHTAYRGGCELDDDGEVTLTASERQLAEDAGLSREAVHAALGRLRDHGWITLLRPGAGPYGSLWRLNCDRARTVVPLPHQTHSSPPMGGVVVSGLSVRAGSDAFRRGALGVNGYRVLRALMLWGPSSTAELAERLGLNQGSVARLLTKKLGACGLVERQGTTWAVLDSVVFDNPSPAARPAAPVAAQSAAGTESAAGEPPADGLDAGGSGAARGDELEEDPELPVPAVAANARVVSVVALGAVAERFGTTGRGLRQRDWHNRERDEYRRSASYTRGTAAWSDRYTAAAHAA